MSGIQLTVTDAGFAKLVNAKRDGTAPVLVSAIGFTATAFMANAAMTALPGELVRLSTIGGTADAAANTIHVTATDTSAAAYTARGFGLYLDDGTLLALYGQPDPITAKTSASMLLLAVDAVFVSIDVTSLTFGAPMFANPPATTEQQGISELATPAETIAGIDATRVVTPAGLKAAGTAATRWQMLPPGTALTAGVRLIPDNTAGACSYSLPAAPADGDVIEFRQGATSFGDFSATFTRAGKTIMSLAEDMTVTDPTACGAIVWRANLNTWWVYATGISGTAA